MGDERDQEAEKCIDVAKRALSDGDLQKSIKFLKKSLNFRHSATAENLLKKVEEELAHSTTSPRRPPQSSPSPPPPSSSTSSPPSSNDASSTSSSTSSNTTNSGPAKRPRASSGASSGSGASSSSASSDAPKRDFTPEQQAAARKINKLTDYYQILGIERTADDAAIKAAYRKMALKFHPDKNHAPEAEEAFKKVSEAYTTLSDGNEREYYNQHGNRGNAQRAARAAYANAGAGAYRDTPMTPEELFNMFFEAQGIRRQQHFHRQRQYQAGEGGQQRGGLMNLAHFLPLILLFLFSFMSGPSSEQTVFSLDKSDVYSIRRTTPAQTPYFVAPSFARNYARDYRALATIEAQADQQYLNKLRELCKAETKEQKMKINEAKKSKADDQPQRLQAAMSMPLPSCDRLSSIGQH